MVLLEVSTMHRCRATHAVEQGPAVVMARAALVLQEQAYAHASVDTREQAAAQVYVLHAKHPNGPRTQDSVTAGTTVTSAQKVRSVMAAPISSQNTATGLSPRPQSMWRNAKSSSTAKVVSIQPATRGTLAQFVPYARMGGPCREMSASTVTAAQAHLPLSS